MLKNAYVLSVAALLGCSADFVAAPVEFDESMVWDITLNHKSLVMSLSEPFDTITLEVVPRNVYRQTLPVKGTTYFTSTTRELIIDSIGKVQALGKTDLGWVLVEFVSGNIRLKDSVAVTIIDTADYEPVDSLSMDIGGVTSQPMFSAMGVGLISLWREKDLVVKGIPFNSDTVVSYSLPMRYWVSDTTVAVIDPLSGSLTGLIPDREVWVYSAVTFLGRVLIDSAKIEIVPPRLGTIGVSYSYADGSKVAAKRFSPDLIEISIGGTVTFSVVDDSVMYDVSFSDPEKLVL